MTMKVSLLILASILFISCGSDKSKELGRASSFEELMGKLSTNLDTFEPQKEGYQNTMEEKAVVVYGNSDGSSVTCNTTETTIETILEVRPNSILIHRQKSILNDPNNPQGCGTVAIPAGPVLVLANREEKDSIMDEFRRSFDSGEITLQGVRDLGNNRFMINASTVVNNDITVEVSVTVDFGVPYFMMNLESSGRARGFANQTLARRTGYNMSVNTRSFNTRGLRTVDERE